MSLYRMCYIHMSWLLKERGAGNSFSLPSRTLFLFVSCYQRLWLQNLPYNVCRPRDEKQWWQFMTKSYISWKRDCKSSENPYTFLGRGIISLLKMLTLALLRWSQGCVDISGMFDAWSFRKGVGSLDHASSNQPCASCALLFFRLLMGWAIRLNI